jgi:SAM-dependent methyltransferase
MRSDKMNLAKYFVEPLLDMGEVVDDKFSAIYCTENTLSTPKLGITNQFMDNAEEYHRRYLEVDTFKGLLSKASEHFTLPAEPVILDLGSGSGNTVFAALDLFPSASMIATDLSEHLLRILRDYAANIPAYKDRLLLVCQDACNEIVQPNSMDLVLGGSILHHLLYPDQAIIHSLNALKPGGYAVFFEPFENGCAILRLAYNEILRLNDISLEPIEKSTADFIKAIENDYAYRTGVDKSAPHFKEMDDKWLFTKTYFENCAAVAKARSVTVYSDLQEANLFQVYTETLLRIGLNKTKEALPSWVWQILERYDSTFSNELKMETLIEATVVIKK